ncbi:MAG: FixH family protein, partial [Rhodospirillaceae bacterium]|nr:FixH family protein [Rhodospirillaceae bacterium]
MTGRLGATQARLERFMREDRWIPWTFVAAFLVLIAVNGILVVRAVESWPGVESANAYEEGLAYNRTLEEARRQKALGWRYAFAFTPAGERAGRIEVSLYDRDGAALSQAKVD